MSTRKTIHQGCGGHRRGLAGTCGEGPGLLPLGAPGAGSVGRIACFMCSRRADRAYRASVARMPPSWSPDLSSPSDRDRRASPLARDDYSSPPAGPSAPLISRSNAPPSSSAHRPRAQSVSGRLAATDIPSETLALARVAACSIQDSLASTGQLLLRFQCHFSISLARRSLNPVMSSSRTWRRRQSSTSVSCPVRWSSADSSGCDGEGSRSGARGRDRRAMMEPQPIWFITSAAV